MTKLAHVKKPCNNCPFLRDGGIRLHRARIVEILKVVAPADHRGGTFPCHKTVDHHDRRPAEELACAGAYILAYKVGRTTQMMRIGERLGMVAAELATDAHPEVFDDEREMLASAIRSARRTAARASSPDPDPPSSARGAAARSGSGPGSRESPPRARRR